MTIENSLRIAITLVMMFGSVCAEDRRPKNAAGAGEQSRLEHSPPVQDAAPQSPAVLCITVKGIDYDLEPILAVKTAEWTWPGGTEASLREHLWIAHGIAGTARLPFVTLRKIHAVFHEREEADRKRVTVTTQTTSTAVSSCPGGICPAPAYRMQTTTVRRGRQWFR